MVTTKNNDKMKTKNKLTKTETNALEFSNKLWDAIIKMEKECKIHPDDIHDFRKDINAIQNRIMSRLAVRLHPDLFHIHNEKSIMELAFKELNKYRAEKIGDHSIIGIPSEVLDRVKKIENEQKIETQIKTIKLIQSKLDGNNRKQNDMWHKLNKLIKSLSDENN